ncbi:PAS domain-containing sensor histidine kinase [Bradyrhizobium paxllaeri]|uniref:PAS domain-containing sensor histidine kinase n=1 Tax=Bradyrhizobium paxllaeri TaxID=190148 RepID=UPI0008109A56|nr:PAS domain-containing sensor histidine kinase [Bradyrhizobium paxllaeri]
MTDQMTGDRRDIELPLRRTESAYRYLRSAKRPLCHNQSGTAGAHGTTIDANEHKQADVALSDREQELLQLLDVVPSLLWRLKPDGKLIYFNQRMVDFLGLDVTETVKSAKSGIEAVIATVHPDDSAEFAQTLRRCLVTGETFAMRYRLKRADGVYRWMSGRAEPIRDQGGCIAQWYGVCHDIDDQMHAEAALRRSERQLQQLIDTVPALIWCTTPEGIPCYLNKRVSEVTGVTLRDLVAPDGSRSLTVIHPDDRDAMDQALAHSIDTGASFVGRYRQRRSNGAHRWVESRAEPLRDESGKIVQWFGVSVDIHDLVIAQEALRDRERELSQLVDMVPSLLWRLNRDGEPNFFNKRTIEFLGSDVADYDKPGVSRLAATLAAIIHPDDTAGVLEGFNHSLATGAPFSMTYRLRRADGVHRWMSGRAYPMRDESGHIIQWYGLTHDVDDQMRAEEAVRLSERRLQQMIDAVPVYIFSFTAAGQPTYVNKRYQDYLGFSVPHFDSLQEQLRTTTHPDDLPEMQHTLLNCLQTGEPFLMRFRQRGKDGIYRWTEGRAEPLRDQESTIVQWYAVSLDIEDERRAQDALQQASANLAQAAQAASLAELSASIAHEVNQPLAAIVANSHACKRWLEGDPPNLERAKATVERVIRNAHSAAEVVSHTRALFRQDLGPRISGTLASVVAEARNLVAEEAARRNVRMEIDIERSLPLLAFDRVQLQQVLVNLIRNGMDAMDSLTGDKALRISVRRMEDTVQIAISDHGRGIEFPEKIFEPFFTTKEHGMGMGLAICRSIVESHGGRLWAERNERNGATFTFSLPIDVKDDANEWSGRSGLRVAEGTWNTR